MSRIAVAGFMHETNTFSPIPADVAAFVRPATLPGLTAGADMPARFAGLNVPIAGAMRMLHDLGHRVEPILWASAVPCGRVTLEAFETISGLMLDGIKATPAPDGLYLDLHGAMVAEHLDDPETELLRRLRAAVGDGVPIVASFDLHANLSPNGWRCWMARPRSARTRISTWPTLARAPPHCCTAASAASDSASPTGPRPI